MNFQDRVQPWMMACFGEQISRDRVERADRLLEEVLELLQSGGYDPARVLALRDYVWNRLKGEPSQEVGGVMVTLAAYCLAHDLDMHGAGETELARIWTKVEAIRAKQAAKPTGSALPISDGNGEQPRRSPLTIAEAWYSVDEIHRSINGRCCTPGDHDAPPRDVTSREFAEWMTNQYRLAMAKGIQLGRNRSEDEVKR